MMEECFILPRSEGDLSEERKKTLTGFLERKRKRGRGETSYLSRQVKGGGQNTWRTPEKHRRRGLLAAAWHSKV